MTASIFAGATDGRRVAIAGKPQLYDGLCAIFRPIPEMRSPAARKLLHAVAATMADLLGEAFDRGYRVGHDVAKGVEP